MDRVSNPTEVAAVADPYLPPPRAPHPWQFLILVLPLGLQVAWAGPPLEHAISRHHVSESVLAGLIALSIIPPSWKFLWAPVVDTTFTRRTWYVSGVIATGLCDWLVTRIDDDTSLSLTMLTFWMVAASVATEALGVGGMLLSVAALGVTAIATYVLVVRLTRQRQPMPVYVPTPE